MGFAIEEKLERLLRHPHRKLSRSVVLALRKNYGQKMKKRPSSDAAANANPNEGSEKFVGFGDVTQAWLPDGDSQIFRSYVFGPLSLKDYGSATLRCKI